MADDLTERIAVLAEDAPGVGDRRRRPRRADGGRRRGSQARSGSPSPARSRPGKSTLLNALIGEDLAPTDAGECTRIVTWYRHADRPYATSSPSTATPRGTAVLAAATAPSRSTSAASRRGADRPPRDRLADAAGCDDLVLIDTPGHRVDLDRGVRAHPPGAVRRDGPGARRRRGALPAAAHPRADLRFLESFHDDEVARGHAGEHGRRAVAGRRDRLVRGWTPWRSRSGSRAATRPTPGCTGCARSWSPSTACSAMPPPPCARRSTPRCAAVARAPADEIAELLLTADRFARRESPVPVPVPERGAAARPARALRRPAVRRADPRGRGRRPRPSCRDGSPSVSGLDRLREVVLRQFDAAGARPQGALRGRGAARDLPAGRLRRTVRPCCAGSSRSPPERTSSRRSGSCSSCAPATSR